MKDWASRTLGGRKRPHDGITARERIDGTEYVLLLKPDEAGCYREVRIEPATTYEHTYVDSSLCLG